MYTHHSTVGRATVGYKAWHINYSGTTTGEDTSRGDPRPILVETATTPTNRMSCGTLRPKLATRSRLLEVESRQDAGIGQSGRLRLVAGASDACDVDRGVGSGDGRAGCLLEDPLDLGDAVATLGDVVRGADGVAHEDRVQLERLHTTSN